MVSNWALTQKVTPMTWTVSNLKWDLHSNTQRYYELHNMKCSSTFQVKHFKEIPD